MSALQPILAPTYTCHLCKKTFAPSELPIVGEDPKARTIRIVTMLADHIGKVHKERMIGIAMAANQFQGWSILEQFDHTDPDLHRESNGMRLQYRQLTKRVNITDEMITGQVDTFLKLQPGTQRDATIELLKTMRDVLEENPTILKQPA